MPANTPERRAADRPAELNAFDLAELHSASAMYAAVVREARRAAGATLEDLATRVGVPVHVVELWEDPNWEGHDLSTLRRVARALGSRLELRISPARQHTAAPKSVTAA